MIINNEYNLMMQHKQQRQQKWDEDKYNVEEYNMLMEQRQEKELTQHMKEKQQMSSYTVMKIKDLIRDNGEKRRNCLLENRKCKSVSLVSVHTYLTRNLWHLCGVEC